MTWVKVDDGFYSHPKARAVGKDGRALYLAGLCYSGGQLTDGLITVSTLPLLAALAEVDPAIADLLVASGLWDLRDDGYMVHDYVTVQRTRDDVERAREHGRERAKRSRELRANYARSAREYAKPDTDTDTDTDTERDIGPLIAIPEPRDARPKRATKVPDPFPVTSEMVEWAKVNAAGVDLDWETDQLVDWARGKGETKKDWVATWRTWMRRRAKESAPKRSDGSGETDADKAYRDRYGITTTADYARLANSYPDE